ncbi:MAG: FAD-dependent oxidoreductase [Gammaproteobacteria bacterium]
MRCPETAAREDYDLIILGGGIQGAMLALEASVRGLRALLLEMGDFGGATSFNSLRILHGGLRYLQTADLKRFHESVRERRWFLRNFPDLVTPLPCLMPLYGAGLHRPGILRGVLKINDLLSADRNLGVSEAAWLPDGRVVDARTARESFPRIRTGSLRGGAIWHDAFMPDSQRVLMEVLRRAAEFGATVLNYVEATSLVRNGEHIAGILAVDHDSGDKYEFRATTVLNATGPWNSSVAGRMHAQNPDGLQYSMAWNVLLDRAPLSSHALAVAAPRPDSQTLFLCPWKGRLLAGTGHLARPMLNERAGPGADEIAGFLGEINAAVPGLDLQARDVIRVLAGYLPARPGARHSLAVRETIVDHGLGGGPRGMFTVAGIKFTTARSVAEKALNMAFGQADRSSADLDADGWRCRKAPAASDFEGPDDIARDEQLRTLVRDEAVLHLDDLVLRRTALWDTPEQALILAPGICRMFDWNQQRRAAELRRLEEQLGAVDARSGRERGDVAMPIPEIPAGTAATDA